MTGGIGFTRSGNISLRENRKLLKQNHGKRLKSKEDESNAFYEICSKKADPDLIEKIRNEAKKESAKQLVLSLSITLVVVLSAIIIMCLFLIK